jgi:hypothetical protein
MVYIDQIELANCKIIRGISTYMGFELHATGPNRGFSFNGANA